MTDSTQENRKKGKAGLIILLVLLVLAAAALGGASYAYRRYTDFCEAYADRFLPGTKINKIDVEGMTTEEVEKRIEDSIDAYTLTVRFDEDHSETITDKDIEYHYVSDGGVQKLMDAQDIDQFLLSWLKERKVPETVTTVGTATEYSSELLAKLVYAFPELETPDPVEPVDAVMTYADGVFSVTPEQQGSETEVNKEPVLTAVVKAVDALQSEVDVSTLEDVYTVKKIKAKVTAKKLQKKADELNRYLSSSITYTLPNGSVYTLDYNTTFDWLTVSEDGEYSVNEDIWRQKAAEYVASLAAEVNNVGAPRTFEATGIGTYTVYDNEGYSTYGYTVNQEAETDRLFNDLISGTVDSRQMAYSSWETADFNDGLGNSYVELDLSRQHMWIYQYGTLVLETDIVSGNMDQENHTPQGIYMVYAKEHNSTLKGKPDPATNKPEYEVPVRIWMPFIQSLQIGLHDADWRSEFGGDIYIYDGSNGCINCPADRIDEIEAAVTWDMPVIVYYSDGLYLHD